MGEGVNRAELLDSYAHPYRRLLPVSYRIDRVPEVAAAALGLSAGALGFELLDDQGAPGLLVLLAAAVALAAVVRAIYSTLVGVQAIHARTRDWRTDDAELARVRVRRPHAGQADPVLAHAEYAVSVSDDGCLETWRFEPLRAGGHAPAGRVMLRGKPRYSAHVVDSLAFEASDAALAAEQLVLAQEGAAQREAAAAEQAHIDLQVAERARELEAETRSTGVALRGATGQSD